MALVTFTSDFGHGDHYVAAVKATLLSQDSALNIIDISHAIKSFDIAHMAFVVGSVFKKFPPGTIHLLGTNVGQSNRGSYLATKIEDHYFVAPNNGIISIISHKSPEFVIELSENQSNSTFPQINEAVDAVIQLKNGIELTTLGKQITNYTQLMLRQPRATRKEIAGHVIHVDKYGNLITNIKKQDFDILSKGKTYKIIFGRDTTNTVNTNYFDVEAGEAVFLFNSLNVLEIAINQGNASTLLGLNYDSPIVIQFEE